MVGSGVQNVLRLDPVLQKLSGEERNESRVQGREPVTWSREESSTRRESLSPEWGQERRNKEVWNLHLLEGHTEVGIGESYSDAEASAWAKIWKWGLLLGGVSWSLSAVCTPVRLWNVYVLK